MAAIEFMFYFVLPLATITAIVENGNGLMKKFNRKTVKRSPMIIRIQGM